MDRTSGKASNLVFVCPTDDLGEGVCRKVDALFKGEVDSIWVLRYQGELKAYRNLCVHMPRTLDCEAENVFDQSQGYLRCSMHGIVYSPDTGESLSEICRGKKLTAVRVLELEQRIYIDDRRVRALI